MTLHGVDAVNNSWKQFIFCLSRLTTPSGHHTVFRYVFVVAGWTLSEDLLQDESVPALHEPRNVHLPHGISVAENLRKNKWLKN